MGLIDNAWHAVVFTIAKAANIQSPVRRRHSVESISFPTQKHTRFKLNGRRLRGRPKKRRIMSISYFYDNINV